MLDIEKRDWRCAWLDALRTVLALYVVFAHAVPWAVYLQGHQGLAETISNKLNNFAQPHGETNLAVLAFIVLSGYCIHRSGLGNGLRSFATRRAFRILPVYFAAAVFGAVVFALVALAFPAVKAITDTNDISVVCMTAKLTAITAFVPSLSECAFQGNAPLRTVGTEIWLYAAYPIGLFIVRQFGERWLWIAIASIAIGGFVTAEHIEALGWWRNDSMPGFLLFWWLGAKALDRRAARYLALASIVALPAWVGLAGVADPWIVEIRQISVAVMVAAALPAIDRPQESRSTELLGRAGYSIYAFHAPIIYGLIAFGFHWWIALLAAASFGIVTFYLIERPMERRGRSIATA